MPSFQQQNHKAFEGPGKHGIFKGIKFSGRNYPWRNKALDILDKGLKLLY